MNKVLFSADGNIFIKDNKIQIIPTGVNADDCECCGGVLPNPCEGYCSTHPDGPFSSASYEGTVGGFPASFVWETTASFGFGFHSRWTLTGLDAANGIWDIEWDPELCGIIGRSITIPLSLTQERWQYSAPNGDTMGDSCTWSNPQPTLMHMADSQLNLQPTGYQLSGGLLVPSFGGLTGFSSHLTITDGCSDGTGSSTYTRNFCGTSSSFTYTADWVFTGVP